MGTVFEGVAIVCSSPPPPFLFLQVYARTVKLLTDVDLEDLGLCMGDRATLREKCPHYW